MQLRYVLAVILGLAIALVAVPSLDAGVVKAVKAKHKANPNTLKSKHREKNAMKPKHGKK